MPFLLSDVNLTMIDESDRSQVAKSLTQSQIRTVEKAQSVAIDVRGTQSMMEGIIKNIKTWKGIHC